MVYIPEEWIWIVVLGFVLAFLLCLGIGANDVANTFGTSVGSKVLTLKQACILASIFETAGAVFLGAKVSETVRKGIIDVSLYENSTEEFLIGNIAALSGSALWLGIATFARLPVSTTHSIVGATVGFALVANGARGIDWWGLGKIVLSWFISPVLSGFITLGVFMFCDVFILKKADPLEPGLRLLPLFYGVTIVVNVFSIFYEGPEMFYFDRIPLWGVFLLSFGIGIICATAIRFMMVPWQRRKIIEECTTLHNNEKMQMSYGTPTKTTTFGVGNETKENQEIVGLSYNNTGFVKSDNSLYEGPESKSNESTSKDACDSSLYQLNTAKAQEAALSDAVNGMVGKGALGPDSLVDSQKIINEEKKEEEDEDEEEVKDRPENAKLFSFLQILTAIFGAFAHGGNDVSNGIGPLISIWLVATTQEIEGSSLTPIWILAYGGVGISIGLWIWGRRVIQTMGEDLTTVTPSSGFCIEIGAAMTVLFASNLGIPVSSTHCKVGSIVFVGRARSKKNVDWSLFRNIIMSWVITLPACMAFSAIMMALLSLTL